MLLQLSIASFGPFTHATLMARCYPHIPSICNRPIDNARKPGLFSHSRVSQQSGFLLLSWESRHRPRLFLSAKENIPFRDAWKPPLSLHDPNL